MCNTQWLIDQWRALDTPENWTKAREQYPELVQWVEERMHTRLVEADIEHFMQEHPEAGAKLYMWQCMNGIFDNELVDAFNHCMRERDAAE